MDDYLININEELKMELDTITTGKSSLKNGETNFEKLSNKISILELEIENLTNSKEKIKEELYLKQDEIKQVSLYIEQFENANSSQLKKIEELHEILKLKEIQLDNQDSHTEIKSNDVQ